MSPSEVLFAFKVAGGKIHHAGVVFGEAKKPKDPKDAVRLLLNAEAALEEALEAVRSLLD